MKIHPAPVPDFLRPSTQGFIWPPGSDDYGVEQDFGVWLDSTAHSTPGQPDWLYFAAYWNRWFWQYPDDRHNADLLQPVIDEVLKLGRVFTIAEYGLIGEHPELNFGDMVIFAASRRGDTREIDIPLLLYPHYLRDGVDKRWLASFAGNYVNDAVRQHTYDTLESKRDIRFDEGLSIKDYTLLMQESYIALAPRGVGLQSYRFYEAMQAGTVPLLISDVDSRPFKKWIDWDACSLYRESHEGLYDFMKSIPSGKLVEMGAEAKRVWHEQLQYGKWCTYVTRELKAL